MPHMETNTLQETISHMDTDSNLSTSTLPTPTTSSPTLAAIIRPKTWLPSDFGIPPSAHDGRPLILPTASHPQAASFLRDDTGSKVSELNINIKLTAAEAARRCKNWQAMIAEAKSAEAIATQNFANYPPIVARCRYYLAIGTFRTGRTREAIAVMREAKEVKGAYIEGETWQLWYDVMLNASAKEGRKELEQEGLRETKPETKGAAAVNNRHRRMASRKDRVDVKEVKSSQPSSAIKNIAVKGLTDRSRPKTANKPHSNHPEDPIKAFSKLSITSPKSPQACASTSTPTDTSETSPTDFQTPTTYMRLDPPSSSSSGATIMPSHPTSSSAASGFGVSSFGSSPWSEDDVSSGVVDWEVSFESDSTIDGGVALPTLDTAPGALSLQDKVGAYLRGLLAADK